MTEQKLLPIDHCRHLAFAAIGGFFGGYALLCRGGILGSSQTMNLVELVIRLGQTVSNRAKAIISEKASFFMQRRSAPDDRMSALEN